MRPRLLPIIAAAVFATSSAFADPSGSYTISGTNPDGSAYNGSVLVAKVGETFTVNYTVGAQTFTGTGLGDDDVISIGYTAGGQDVGVALMVADGNGGFEGVWAYLGSKSMGQESWTAAQ
ncbi:hypothetical protein FP2506_07451 [Fulvimarina pelagi HTCC2506]|uniref:Uncharacterized protein n=1 Tax=Fulvimarina pelagi HTCC2506 TaxID=314231 RepID=Q0G6Q6_9HYPH|nr:hypothetical protein [Fulvimarina pelagi]EAU42658.1 hypothetical protein FP2506_07451 [Fulvimarina pelagi HTCC2506]